MTSFGQAYLALMLAFFMNLSLVNGQDSVQQKKAMPSVAQDTSTNHCILFQHHLFLLDSVDSNLLYDPTMRRIEAIRFLEQKTYIMSSGDGTWVGKYSFTSENLRAWHAAYEKLRRSGACP